MLAELKARKLALEQNRALLDQQIRQTQLSIEAIEADQKQARGPATAPTGILGR